MEIPADQLKFEVYPIHGIHQKGGQHVGVPNGVQVMHLPSGLKAYVDIGRSQHVHKQIAMEMILAAITHPKFR